MKKLKFHIKPISQAPPRFKSQASKDAAAFVLWYANEWGEEEWATLATRKDAIGWCELLQRQLDEREAYIDKATK